MKAAASTECLAGLVSLAAWTVLEMKATCVRQLAAQKTRMARASEGVPVVTRVRLVAPRG
jgi:hypothetical protein